jgi:Zn-dependent M28 family amino/carboxypeptidase
MSKRFLLLSGAGGFMAAAALALLLPVSAGTAAQAVITAPSPARYLADVTWLSRPEMKGRGSGSPELEQAAEYIAEEFRKAGLKPAGENGSWFQSFEVTTGAELGARNALALGGTAFARDADFVALPISNTAAFEGALVFAGYGISAPELGYDDYAGIDATGKIVVVLRHEPQEADAASKFAGTNYTQHATFVNKAINARNHGAKGIVFLSDPLHTDEEVGPATRRMEHTDMGIPAVHAKRERFFALFRAAGHDMAAIQAAIDRDLMPRSFDLRASRVRIETEVVRHRARVRNVIGMLEGSDPVLKDEYVVVGAHYDHLGLGDESSLAPSQIGQVHHGADDNASGTAGVMELARLAANDNVPWKRSALFMAFAAEEIGLLGSASFVGAPTVPLEKITAMINMDMVGRIQNDRVFVGGIGTAANFRPILEAANSGEAMGLTPNERGGSLMLDFSDSGYGASDHTSFNAKKIPVLFFFSGLHTDYHKPSDTVEKINPAGAVKLLSLVHGVMGRLADEPVRLAYVEVTPPAGAPGRGGGGGYGPWFGSVPDFRDDLMGVLFADIVNGSPAAKAGLRPGDLLVEFDGKPVRNLNDYSYLLRTKQVGDTVPVMVKRMNMDVRVNVTLEARR